MNTPGFGDAGNFYIGSFAVFNGELYAATHHDDGAGTEIWRCTTCDGSDWEQIIDNGFGDPATRRMPALEVIGDRLYLSLGNVDNGIQVWQTLDGDTWVPIAPDGFADPDNLSNVWDPGIVGHDGMLFVGTWNPDNGGEIWRRKAFGAELDPVADTKADHPGETVVYSIEVTNNGEEVDTFDITLSGNSWVTTADPTIGPLDPGEMDVLTVEVTIPPTAVLGDSDLVTVTVTSQGDGLEYSEAELTTTIYVYELYLPLITR